MSELTADLGEVEIVYETFGDATEPTILLIMGLGVQMLGWDERFCRMLAERGFQVVRFDNRDVGRSTKIAGGPRPNVMAAAAGDFSTASYRLSDMAGDAVGLLDRLGVERAHLVGASLGGMIAQTVAIEHSERVLSLTSMMSTTGDRSVGWPHPAGLEALLRTPPPTDREGFGESAVLGFRQIGSPGFTPDEESVRARALASFDRGYEPLGVARQLVAVGASGDRTAALGKLDVPALVIHGADDVLIDRSGGEATAKAIPGARLEMFEGMGHDLPRDLWPRFIDLIVENTARAASPIHD
jgi:pimeloyl-ACP methyl ester carboxylesterase